MRRIKNRLGRTTGQKTTYNPIVRDLDGIDRITFGSVGEAVIDSLADYAQNEGNLDRCTRLGFESDAEKLQGQAANFVLAIWKSETGKVPSAGKIMDIIQSAQACRLLALTWVRTQELRMMEWTEIDGDLWRIPAGKMKRRRDHLVPLSKQALVILENMRQRGTGSVYVFPNDRSADRPMSENAVLYLIGRIGYGGKMTGHGWRSVASTWANEAGHNKDAIERQLAHAPDDKVRATYNRAEYLPERKTMLQAWSDWLTKEGQPSPGTTDASSASSE